MRDVPVRMVIGNAESHVEAVSGGLGVAQLPTWLIAGELQSGKLIQILPALATDGLPLHILWPRSRQLLPKVDALLTHLGNSLIL